jgi:GMP synthase-like glutamine amidotransferase
MHLQESVRVAVLDMNKGTKNLGIPSILAILDEASTERHLPRFDVDVFDVRVKEEVPDLDYDLFISSGGPGSPFDGRNKRWEAGYLKWLDTLWRHNETAERPKHALFICHSFEMMCHFFGLAEVGRRRSPSFGIYPVHLEDAGLGDPLFENLENPFWGADFRGWQVIQPDAVRLDELRGAVLAKEKIRPHVDLERAVMAARVGDALVGVQFHPEAAPDGMRRHFNRREKRMRVIAEHGRERYEKMLAILDPPSPLEATRRLVIPNFLREAVHLELPLPSRTP